MFAHRIFTFGSIVFTVLLTLSAEQATAQTRQPGWTVDAQSGCRVWNPSPEPEDSIKWQGPCVNGFADGKGVLRWYSIGNHYETDEGEFREGKLNGFAILTWTSGRRFEGMWRDQKPNGQGTLRTSDGEVYTGEWRNGCFKQGSRLAVQDATMQECGFQ
jgi:hypothetical protein